MAARPDDNAEALHRWFWEQTGMAALIHAVANGMADSDDPAVQNLARGLVR